MFHKKTTRNGHRLGGMEDLESVHRGTDVYDPAEKGSPGLGQSPDKGAVRWVP